MKTRFTSQMLSTVPFMCVSDGILLPGFRVSMMCPCSVLFKLEVSCWTGLLARTADQKELWGQSATQINDRKLHDEFLLLS